MASDSIFDYVDPEAVFVFVGAHPDDETIVSPLLAYCAENCREIVVVSLTRGQSGWNLARPYDDRTLADVRQAELSAAMKILHCTPITYDYVNGTSSAHPDGLAVHDGVESAVARWHECGSKRISPEEHYQRWIGEAGDPADRLLELFRRKKPSVVLALELENGFTGHPEHITATMAAQKALGMYNEGQTAEIPLFGVHPTEQQVAGAQTIAAADLQARGGKDYRHIAWESWNCYESQYGPNDGEKLSNFMSGCVDRYQLKLMQ